jgi:aspartyl protease family protein
MTAHEFINFLSEQPLLSLAMVAIFVSIFASVIRRPAPGLARLLQGTANLGLAAALLLTIAQVARFTTGSDFALPQMGMPRQSIEGSETHIPMARDGHFWIKATVNGAPQRFMVDTGATLTALSPNTASAAALDQQALRQQVMLRTANGTVAADLVTIDEMRFGNVVARDLDAVVAPGLGETNVIGMNLLSRLASWRVEDNTLILVPHHPQEVNEAS